MKKVSSAQVKSKNRASLIVAALMLVLAIVLLSLPAYEFNATLFTKRSGNTFVGDERYVKAMKRLRPLPRASGSRDMRLRSPSR